jgi:hypothetical protein
MPTNAQQVYDDLQHTYGLPAGAAAGVVGNFVIESNVDPTNASGDGGTSGGIAQWHLERLAALKRFAASLGRPWQSLDVQEAYAVKEAKDSGLWTRLAGTTDPAAAASLWASQFERPASHDYSDRQAAAQKIYTSGGAGLGSTADGSSSGSSAGGDGFVAQPAADGGGGPLGIGDVLKTIAAKGAVGLFGLGLIGFGVVTAAKRTGGGA